MMENVDFMIYQKQLKFVTMHFFFTDHALRFMIFLSAGMYNLLIGKVEVSCIGHNSFWYSFGVFFFKLFWIIFLCHDNM